MGKWCKIKSCRELKAAEGDYCADHQRAKDELLRAGLTAAAFVEAACNDRAALLSEGERIIDAADSSDRALIEDEKAKRDAITARVAEKTADIDRREKLQTSADRAQLRHELRMLRLAAEDLQPVFRGDRRHV